MTSAHFMRPDRCRVARLARAMLGLLATGMTLTGCARQLHSAAVLQSPYGQNQLWAIAPLTNESGVSFVDTARLADAFAEQAQQVAGVDVVPVNRVIGAMRELNLPAVRTVGDARALMSSLDVDGLIVGTVTAYDPYRPPRLGMAVQLFVAERASQYAAFDTRELTLTTVGEPAAPGGMADGIPVAQAAGVFDAVNHGTLMALRAYAAGRTEPDSAYGDDIYLVRMELFARFVSHQLIRDLLKDERLRLMLASSPDAPR